MYHPTVRKEDFELELKRLQGIHEESHANVGCVQVEGCSGCVDCVFCNGCERCFRSRYCNRCVDSVLITHCHDCRRCRQSAYLIECSDCSDSNYLFHSSSCSECDYCFGCVGLLKKEFHILNQKYSRGEYFRIIADLKQQYGIADA